MVIAANKQQQKKSTYQFEWSPLVQAYWNLQGYGMEYSFV